MAPRMKEKYENEIREQALERAVQKGGLKRPGEAWMRLAVANYNLNSVPDTQAALQQAMKYDESRKQAGEWLRHLSGQVAAEPVQPALL